MPLTSFLVDSHYRVDFPVNWTLNHASGEVPPGLESKLSNIPAQVPGCVHLDLLREGLIPDPYIGLNEKEMAWIDLCTWSYSTSFNYENQPGQIKKSSKQQLVFTGLDTFTEIFLDNVLIAKTENMFTPQRIDLGHHLEPGKHDIKIIFKSPVKAIDGLVEKFGRVPDAFGGDRGWIRKAQYSYGWDWGPILPTSGIWQEAYIQEW